MDYEANVWLVDAHTESYRGNNDIKTLHEEIVLCGRAGRRVKTGMICSRLDVVGLQHSRKLLNLFARQTIYDAALSRILLNELYYLLVDVFCLMSYFIIKVGTVE